MLKEHAWGQPLSGRKHGINNCTIQKNKNLFWLQSYKILLIYFAQKTCTKILYSAIFRRIKLCNIETRWANPNHYKIQLSSIPFCKRPDIVSNQKQVKPDSCFYSLWSSKVPITYWQYSNMSTLLPLFGILAKNYQNKLLLYI